ncbi:MAG: hypothetical protein IPP71_05800 [Bacteroidetes bacterium]|nr:hypothetical protein [Bacteroidota bacterium]
MDTTHLHLLLNHFPIIGTLIAIVILAYGVLVDSRRTAKISLAVLVVMSLIAIPVFLTGEPAEESVEKLPGVAESIIEDHEEAAEVAIWMMAVLGVLAALSFVNLISSNKINKSLVGITLFVGFITFGAMARTGYLGGQIRHSEIRQGIMVKNGLEGNQEQSTPSEKDDD